MEADIKNIKANTADVVRKLDSFISKADDKYATKIELNKVEERLKDEQRCNRESSKNLVS